MKFCCGIASQHWHGRTQIYHEQHRFSIIFVVRVKRIETCNYDDHNCKPAIHNGLFENCNLQMKL